MNKHGLNNKEELKTYEKQVVHTRTRPEPSTLRTVPIFPAPPSWLPQTQSFPKDLHSITILSLIIFHRNYFPKIFENIRVWIMKKMQHLKNCN